MGSMLKLHEALERLGHDHELWMKRLVIVLALHLVVDVIGLFL